MVFEELSEERRQVGWSPALTDGKTIYMIGAAAPPVLQMAEACQALAREGWKPYVILTPSAATWVPVNEIAAVTGSPVRVHPRLPGEQDPFPRLTQH